MVKTVEVDGFKIHISNRGEKTPHHACCECDQCVEVEREDCFLVACISQCKIWVNFVIGKLKEPMDALVKLTGIKDVVFCTIINSELFEKLKNVKRVFTIGDYYHGEETECVEVEWIT